MERIRAWKRWREAGEEESNETDVELEEDEEREEDKEACLEEKHEERTMKDEDWLGETQKWCE